MALVTRADHSLARTKDLASNRLGMEIDDRSRSIAQLEAALTKRDYELNHLRNEVSNLDSENETQRSIIAPVENFRTITDIAPEDAYDIIARRENMLKLEERRLNALKRSVHDLPLVIAMKTKELESVENHLQYVTDVTGWCPHRKPMDQVTFDKTMRDITEMELLINRLEDEKKTNLLISRKKEQLLETLNAELVRKKDLHESLLTLSNSIRVVDRDVREAELLMNTRKQEHSSTDMVLVSVEGSRDLVVFSSLEDDIKFLQGELEKHQAIAKEQHRMLKTQQFRMEQLEARVEVVVTAVQDLGLEKDAQVALKGAIVPVSSMIADDITLETILPRDETIDVELFELLHRDLSELRNASSMKDILTLEKGATLEALARKLEIMLASKRIESSVYEQERAEQEHQILELRQQLEDQQQQWLTELEGPTKQRLQMQRDLSKSVVASTTTVQRTVAKVEVRA